MLQMQAKAMPAAPPRSQPLPPAASLMFDLIRVVAAILIAVAHLSQGWFTTGWSNNLMTIGEGAVAAFFVLSGFMIRYITSVKYHDLRRYSADRFARVYSVVLPALLLTILFDVLSAHINPAYYNTYFADTVHHTQTFAAGGVLHATWFRGLIRILLSLFMLAQSWFRDSAPLSNGPFWTLCYECVYYALFGITLYLRGNKRILAFVLVFLLTGPTILLLYPLWLLGCASYDACQGSTPSRASLRQLLVLSVLSLLVVHGTPALIDRLGIRWFYIGRIVPPFGFSAVITAVVLIPIVRALRTVQIREQAPAVRALRTAANATFPLYVTHFPLYVLIAAAIPYPHGSLLAKLFMLAAAITFALLLTGPCDRFKNYLRHTLLPARAQPANANASRPERQQHNHLEAVLKKV